MTARRRPLLVALLVLAASLVPGTGATASPPWFPPDLLFHAVGYAALAATVLASAAPADDLPSTALVVRVVLVVAAFGALVELAQGSVPGRTPSVVDAAANLLGAALGSLAVRERRRRRG